jgi:hypothetical protein
MSGNPTGPNAPRCDGKDDLGTNDRAGYARRGWRLDERYLEMLGRLAAVLDGVVASSITMMMVPTMMMMPTMLIPSMIRRPMPLMRACVMRVLAMYSS